MICEISEVYSSNYSYSGKETDWIKNIKFNEDNGNLPNLDHSIHMYRYYV